MSVIWIISVIEESNEEDNTISGTVEIIDPFDGVTFNVYRALDEVSPAFAMLETGVEEEMYVDQNVTPGDYVYYVTQVTASTESDSSNYGYATVYGAGDFPAPTDLMVEGNEYDAMLEWTAPDLSGWEPPAIMSIIPSNDEKIDDPSTYIMTLLIILP